MTSAKNPQVARIILLLTIMLTLCLIPMAKTASAVEQIDQSNLPEWGGGWTHVNPTDEGQATMWQTFRPACTNVIAVAIDILTNNPDQGDDVLTVEIAKDGNIVASAESSVADGFDGLLRFEFPEAVPLVSEQIYELKVRDTGKTRFGWKYGPNTYERGSRYVFAQERPGTDWFFQTYSNVEPAEAKYSGGTGKPNDPYQIATAEDLILLGESFEDYDKHFILTADIDLDPNLPGHRVFDKAVIAPDTNDVKSGFQGIPFTGIFDGNGHTLSHLTIEGQSFLGLIGLLSDEARLFNLGLEEVDVNGTGSWIGGLVGLSEATVTRCYSTGAVSGDEDVGGLIGENRSQVFGGANSVFGTTYGKYGIVILCYSKCSVNGLDSVGGLMGTNGVIGGWPDPSPPGFVTYCYSTGAVRGKTKVGGLIGSQGSGDITASFWDIDTSGQTTSAGGVGLTTVEMQDINTYLNAGWDFVNETYNGICEYWKILPGAYPSLRYPVIPKGEGTVQEPYLIRDAQGLGIIWFKPLAHYRLDNPIDLMGIRWRTAVIPWFAGTFDGNGLTISHLTIDGEAHMDMIGLFGELASRAEVKDLGIVDVNITASGNYVGGVAGWNEGHVTSSYSTGSISVTGARSWGIGGLAGYNGYWSNWKSFPTAGDVTNCYSTATVTGTDGVGGLVGYNDFGIVTTSYSTGPVTGDDCVGGLMGRNGYLIAGLSGGDVTNCYSTSYVSGSNFVGGLVGLNDRSGRINTSYSSGTVDGNWSVGGLVRDNEVDASITSSFWDIETSGQVTSNGGTGRTTAEMQRAGTFLDAGWDFVGEMANGTKDIWWILEGKDYPRLWWGTAEP